MSLSHRYPRTIDGQGRISFKRYRLYVHQDLKKQRVEIRECLDSLVVIYRSGAVVSYACQRSGQEITSVENAPVFHENRAIEKTLQLELFDLTAFASELRYVTKRQPNRRHKTIPPDAVQLRLESFD